MAAGPRDELGWNHEHPPRPKTMGVLSCTGGSTSMSHNGSSVSSSELDVMRHSASHILAKAVQRLYPGSKLGIGPVIENGFYYDIDVPARLGEDDLPRIEAAMRDIVTAAEPFR